MIHLVKFFINEKNKFSYYISNKTLVIQLLEPTFFPKLQV